MHKTRFQEKTGRWCGVAILFLGLWMGLAQRAHADGEVPGQVLIKIVASANIDRLASDYHSRVLEHAEETDVYGLMTPAKQTDVAFAATLRLDKRVVYAETEAYLNDPELDGTQIHFAFDSSATPGAYINQQAYKQVNLGKSLSITTGAGVIVAVLDTGVTFNHPGLKNHLLPGYNAVRPGALPADIADGKKNHAVGHGTMIAGIIAHLAPGAKIMPIRVLNGDGIGTTLSIIAGLQFAMAHGAQVINMSFGGSQTSEAFRDFFDRAEQSGIIMIASAGNDDTNNPRYPAAFSGVLAVASVESNDIKSGYSNYGAYVAVVAPGTGIRSTYFTGGYANWSGTSFAAPFVSAEAALVLSAHPTVVGDDVLSLIRGTARSIDPFNRFFQKQLGSGIIDIEKAVKADS